MTNLRLGKGDPYSLILAADPRLGAVEFTNDQIWELQLSGGEPPALPLQTSYGLRARQMRIFPRFFHKGKTLADPAQFHHAPVIQQIYPSAIQLVCSPFNGLEVTLEYWVQSSQVIACRSTLANTSLLKNTFRLDWAAVLSPLDEGEPMAPVLQPNQCWLQGKSGNLVPILTMSDCPTASTGPFPALMHTFELSPGQKRVLVWASAACDTAEKSLEEANRVLALPWEAQFTRIKLQHASQIVEIHSGSEDWDTAFAMSQISAYGLITPASAFLPNPSFVLSRQPDQGFSPRGDGSDYSHLWNGQTALDALYLSSLILPGGAELAAGWLENFLVTQAESGMIDWKPGLSGQRGRYQCQPVLATLAWQVGVYLPQTNAWFANLYPQLLQFLRSWFSTSCDRDSDGFPEWEHPFQTGLEDLPIYNQWNPAAQGVAITSLEAPALGAMLYRECRSLLRIAHHIGNMDQMEGIEWLRERMAALRIAIDGSWDTHAGLYRYRDYCSHLSQEGGEIKSLQGSGKFVLRRSFRTPQRLRLQLRSNQDHTRMITVRISGQDGESEFTEEIRPRGWVWTGREGHTTSANLYNSIYSLEIEGVHPDDVLSLYRVDHSQEDISLFLPLWAGIPDSAQAKKMAQETLQRHYSSSYGPPTCRCRPSFPAPVTLNGVSPLWVQMIGEGLIACNQRAVAVEMFTHLMDAITGSLERFHSFREAYDADTGNPLGEHNHLRGLAPVGYFLQLLGIQKLTPQEVILLDFNPFPNTVTVKYHGMTLVCRTAETVVTFPNGQSTRVSGAGAHRVSLT